MINEKALSVPSGYLMLLVLPVLQAATIGGIVWGARNDAVALIIVSILATIVVFILWFGFFLVNPNEAKVIQLFGDYKGTVREPGLRWANPFFSKTKISVRVRNFESGKLKVNDNGGREPEHVAHILKGAVDDRLMKFLGPDVMDGVQSLSLIADVQIRQVR